MLMKLSEKLKAMRTDRPDEWTMDELLRDASKLEKERDEALAKLASMEAEIFALKGKISGVWDSVQADKSAVAVPDGWKLVPAEVDRETALSMIIAAAKSNGLSTEHTPTEQEIENSWKFANAVLEAAPSHSQQSARITYADQFVDGWYYWCKFTNRNAVSYGETVIWKYSQNGRDAPFLAHHPVDAELFEKSEIYGPVPMPESYCDRCPSHESEQKAPQVFGRDDLLEIISRFSCYSGLDAGLLVDSWVNSREAKGFIYLINDRLSFMFNNSDWVGEAKRAFWAGLETGAGLGNVSILPRWHQYITKRMVDQLQTLRAHGLAENESEQGV